MKALEGGVSSLESVIGFTLELSLVVAGTIMHRLQGKCIYISPSIVHTTERRH